MKGFVWISASASPLITTALPPATSASISSIASATAINVASHRLRVDAGSRLLPCLIGVVGSLIDQGGTERDG